jgi:uncharacterized damage-inducible protein DinB
MLQKVDDMAKEMVYIANLIKRAVTGPAWHGPALDHVLKGVSPQQAAAHPIPDAHSIWELTLHVAAWAEIARARLRGERLADPPVDEDWPPVPASPDGTAWDAALTRMRDAYRALAHDARHLDDGSMHDTISGLEYSRWVLLHGVVEHGLYHAGQIALLKKL